MQNMEEASQKKHPNLAAGVITCFVLFLLGMFAWRVFHYTSEIQNNILGAGVVTGGYTRALATANLAIPDGQFDVTTTDDPQLGNPSAKVTIVEFADFGCPFSRQSSFIMRSLASKYPDQIRYIYRDFPVRELHPEAQQAAEAGACAHEQGKFWEYHDKLYLNQSDLSEETLIALAKETNLNMSNFKLCLKGGKYTDEVIEDEQDGTAAGVRGTPTFFINGQRIPGAIPEDLFEKIIDQTLNAKL